MKIIRWIFKILNIKKRRQEKYLLSIFFELVKKNNGLLTVMDFSIEANISGSEAKKYLDKYAMEFEAHFDNTKKGHIIYVFPTRNNNKTYPSKR